MYCVAFLFVVSIFLLTGINHSFLFIVLCFFLCPRVFILYQRVWRRWYVITGNWVLGVLGGFAAVLPALRIPKEEQLMVWEFGEVCFPTPTSAKSDRLMMIAKPLSPLFLPLCLLFVALSCTQWFASPHCMCRSTQITVKMSVRCAAAPALGPGGS